MPPIVSFIGWHNSGKTTVAAAVVSYLKEQGYTVGVIKSSSAAGVEFDNPETDTFKHKAAGADCVMFVGPDQMVLQAKRSELSLQTLAHRYFPHVDIVIGEGFKYARQVAKIEVVRDEEKRLKNQVSGIIAVVTDCDIAGDYVFRTDEKTEVGMFVEKRFLADTKGEKEKTALLVNGQKVPIKMFIQEALAGSVAGLVSSLKLKEDVTDIELRITLKK